MLFFVLLLLLLLSAEGTCQVRSTANSLHPVETDHPIRRRRSSMKEPEKNSLEFHLKAGTSAVPPAVWIKRSQ